MAYVTVNSDVSAVWAKAHGDYRDGINFACEEYSSIEDYPDEDIPPSLREMTYPIQLARAGGVTTLAEGGKEGTPVSANAVDATINFVHKNRRFSISKLAQWAAMDSQGRQAQIKEQIKAQANMAVNDMAGEVSDAFWGLSTGVRATTTTAATQASGTYTLATGYGLSGITNAAFIGNKFQVGDSVALVRSAALVTNAVGVVTARSTSTPSITVTWAGSVTSVSGDQVVLANAYLASTTLSLAATSYNKDYVGMLDMLTSTSLHGISGSTYPEWTVAVADTSGGRFNGVKYRKAMDEIENYGAKSKDVKVWMAQGVYRDVVAQYDAGLRFTDAFSLEIDGDIKGRGKRFERTRRVPPGYTIFQGRDAVRKREIKSADEALGWGNAKEMQDDSGYLLALNMVTLLCCSSRKSLAYYSGLTES